MLMDYNISEWSIADFEKLNWHDCPIYTINLISSKYELIFNIDYILEWIKPDDIKKNYKCIIAPAILKFENAYELKIDIETSKVIFIDNISREGYRENKNTKNYEWYWRINCQEGEICFYSSGFNLMLKEKPIMSQDYLREI
jgi:hypothetical protein